MSRIYLINVGANRRYRRLVRCPIFDDGSFVDVPFPEAEDGLCVRPCPDDAWPFTNGMG